MFVRYRDVTPNRRGVQVGIFALANGLAADGLLSEQDRRWWRASNDWYDAAYVEPASVDPAIFDREANPGAVCWFKASATHLLERVDGYLDLLDRHGVAWERVETDAPGRIVHEDDVQVVAVPAAVEAPAATGVR